MALNFLLCLICKKFFLILTFIIVILIVVLNVVVMKMLTVLFVAFIQRVQIFIM